MKTVGPASGQPLPRDPAAGSHPRAVAVVTKTVVDMAMAMDKDLSCAVLCQGLARLMS